MVRPLLYLCTVAGILATVALWRMPVNETIIAEKQCSVVESAVNEKCLTEYEDRWYFGGSVSELRPEKKKDISLCERIATVAFHTCNQTGEGEAHAGLRRGNHNGTRNAESEGGGSD